LGLREVYVKLSEFGKIDDPFEASLSGWPEEEGNEAGEAALAVGAILPHWFNLAGVIRDRFRNKDRAARVNYLFQGVRLKFGELTSRVTNLERVNEVNAKIASPEFQEAAAVAAEESVVANNPQKIEQFASILVASVDPSISSDSPAEASVLIRDVARLTPMDLKVLGHLEEAYGDLFPKYPNVHDPNPFTEKIQDFKDAVRRSSIHQEEFQSVCERLRGFGFAAEVLRNISRMGPGDYCYRPTRRGLKLLNLLGSLPSSSSTL
jgi:hypothetical protein